MWAENKYSADLVKLNIFCVVQKCLISITNSLSPFNNAKKKEPLPYFEVFDVFSVTWEKILIEWAPQTVKQKTRTQSESK